MPDERRIAMKKILFILPSIGVGGMERVLVTLANRLDAIGHSVTVVTFQPPFELRDELSKNITFKYKPTNNRPGNKIPYIRHKYYDGGMWEKRASARTLYRYFTDGEKFDVEIAFFRGTAIKAISGSTNKNAVRLAWVHSDFSKTDNYKIKFSSDGQIYDAYASFDKVICVSKQAAKAFKETVGDTKNITTIYNPMPVNDILRKSQEAPKIKVKKAALNVVMVSRLFDKAKGLFRAVSAVSRLHTEGADISLTIVGDGEDRDNLRRCISENNAEDYITMTGNQSNPFPYVKAADLMLCASYYEGFPLNVCEAVIIGTPVLSTQCTGPCEILDNGKYGMITENSGQGLYEGLKKLYYTPNLLEEYRQKTAKRIDFFNDEAIIKQITGLFIK